MARVQNNYDPESGELVSRSIINPNGNAQSTQRVDKRLSQADKNRQSLLGMKIKAIQNSVLFDPANPGSELERLSKEYEAIGTSPEVPTAPRRQAPRMQTVTEEGPKGEVIIRQVPDPASTATYATPATPSASSESAETIRAQFRSGKLTQAEAVAKLKKLGFE